MWQLACCLIDIKDILFVGPETNIGWKLYLSCLGLKVIVRILCLIDKGLGLSVLGIGLMLLIRGLHPRLCILRPFRVLHNDNGWA